MLVGGVGGGRAHKGPCRASPPALASHQTKGFIMADRLTLQYEAQLASAHRALWAAMSTADQMGNYNAHDVLYAAVAAAQELLEASVNQRRFKPARVDVRT